MSQSRSKRRSFLAKTLILPPALSSLLTLAWGGENILNTPVAHAMTEQNLDTSSTMRTIQWTCVADSDWEWLSGAGGNQGFSTLNDATRKGTIILPPQENYWYPCITLILQGVTTGNTYLRYFQQNGADVVQALVVAQGSWGVWGNIDPSTSITTSQGGFNLTAQLV